ncbi:hypothetical protein MHYP_G00154130 [Metynnis hypsauchen]
MVAAIMGGTVEHGKNNSVIGSPYLAPSCLALLHNRVIMRVQLLNQCESEPSLATTAASLPSIKNVTWLPDNCDRACVTTATDIRREPTPTVKRRGTDDMLSAFQCHLKLLQSKYPQLEKDMQWLSKREKKGQATNRKITLSASPDIHGCSLCLRA